MASKEQLEKALYRLARVFLEGKNYDTRNPYTRPEIKEAIKLLDPDEYARLYGPYGRSK